MLENGWKSFGNRWPCFEVVQNLSTSSVIFGSHWEIFGNLRKWSEMFRELRKPSVNLRKFRFCGDEKSHEFYWKKVGRYRSVFMSRRLSLWMKNTQRAPQCSLWSKTKLMNSSSYPLSWLKDDRKAVPDPLVARLALLSDRSRWPTAWNKLLSYQRFQFPWMASKLSYQRNVCCSDEGYNHQSPRVTINGLFWRLGHTCRQDYTSAFKQIPRFAGLDSAHWEPVRL